MTKYIAAFIFPFLGINVHAQDASFYNLGFEEKFDQNVPNGWIRWGYYDFALDTIAHSGKYSVKITSDSTLGEFGCAVYYVPAIYKGRKIRLEGYFKSKNVDDYVSLMLRSDDSEGTPLVFSDQSVDKISGTQDWKKYQVSTPYPLEAKRICVAGILSGNGEAWFDDFTLYIDDINVEEIETFRRSKFEDFSFKYANGRQSTQESQWSEILIAFIGLMLMLLILAFLFRKRLIEKIFPAKNDAKIVSSALSKSGSKHQEILDSLQKLIQDEEYLKMDFNLTKAAKMMQTNTSYLSQVVNSEFDKSFREYYTDLRIEYTLQQMNSNKRFRNYTTQAIAESVGYKNALSFSRIFKRKTGLTPAQYVSKVEQELSDNT